MINEIMKTIGISIIAAAFWLFILVLAFDALEYESTVKCDACLVLPIFRPDLRSEK